MLYYIKVLFQIFNKKEKIEKCQKQPTTQIVMSAVCKMIFVKQMLILPTRYYLKSIRFRKYQKAFRSHCFGSQTKVLKNVF